MPCQKVGYLNVQPDSGGGGGLAPNSPVPDECRLSRRVARYSQNCTFWPTKGEIS